MPMNSLHLIELERFKARDAAANYETGDHICSESNTSSDSSISGVSDDCVTLNYNSSANPSVSANVSANTSANTSVSTSRMHERVIPATDKVRAYRDAVVRLMEAHLAGLKHASWLIILLDDYAQVHLPAQWINSPRIVREIIKPSLRRWLDLVQSRFRQRNSVTMANRQVTEEKLLQRSAELREALDKCMRQRLQQ